jgi:hypothetical protein
MYPSGLHGLTALAYALVGLADRGNMGAAIDAMAGIRSLARDRPEDGFPALPLGELTAYGFELLIERALALGAADAFRDHPAYAAYMAERA